jgi:hypothetical protein
MPATLDIRLWHLRPEPGRNLSVRQTVDHVCAQGQTVREWGPYETTREVYARFTLQASWLAQGEVGYQAADAVGGAANGGAVNCVHAVTDSDPFCDRRDFPPTLFGFAAGRAFAARLAAGGLLDTSAVNPWVNALLELGEREVEQGPQPSP